VTRVFCEQALCGDSGALSAEGLHASGAMPSASASSEAPLQTRPDGRVGRPSSAPRLRTDTGKKEKAPSPVSVTDAMSLLRLAEPADERSGGREADSVPNLDTLVALYTNAVKAAKPTSSKKNSTMLRTHSPVSSGAANCGDSGEGPVGTTIKKDSLRRPGR
jgi:hypothetical protein